MSCSSSSVYTFECIFPCLSEFFLLIPSTIVSLSNSNLLLFFMNLPQTAFSFSLSFSILLFIIIYSVFYQSLPVSFPFIHLSILLPLPSSDHSFFHFLSLFLSHSTFHSSFLRFLLNLPPSHSLFSSSSFTLIKTIFSPPTHT